MHIELTDHLRCPETHDEAFLVLLPLRMAGRQVVAGELGCPICHWSTRWDDGIPVFGAGVPTTDAPPVDAEALIAMLGVEGAGGWIALSGSMAALAAEVAARLPGVGVVAINPPATVKPEHGVQVLRSARWPIKQHALRGVACGGEDAAWTAAAVGSVLPGLRAIGGGVPPHDAARFEMLAEADGVWVVRSR
jgi:uncharacterized protein YbaR (Trm112 family)